MTSSGALTLSRAFTVRPVEASRARSAVHRRLTEHALDSDHVVAVDMVVGELISAAIDADIRDRVVLTVEPFALLTSIRLRCPREIELRDDPFRLRERVLERLTLAFGRRRNADGTADLWAEVPRRFGARSASVPAAS